MVPDAAGSSPEHEARPSDRERSVSAAGVAGSTATDTDATDATDENDPPGVDAVEQRLDDALERVAHGATVSVPSILVQRALTLAFTAVLTNGFAAAGYGLFALARRLQRFLLRLALGFRSGLSRYLPNADSTAERDALATFATTLLLAVAALFGAALFLATPLVTGAAGAGPRFGTFLRIFAVGLPAGVAMFTATEILRGTEEVGPLNLALRIGFPAAQLAVGVVGTLVVGDLAFVAAGVVGVMGLTALGILAWLAVARGFRPRLRGGRTRALHRRYVRYTAPLFLAGFATTTQRLGFYPLIALFLSGVAGGVFAVGVLLGSLVRLPLMGINQFVPPVAAALYAEDHHEALARLYHVTSRIVLVGVTGLAVPVIVYRESVMGLFGPTFAGYAWLLPAFVVAQFGACAAGSVGILLRMTDNQRALLVVNVAITAVLAVTAVPLTVVYGLPGLVVSYFLMLTINNGVEVAALYYLEGLQPFTRLHARPLLAAFPLIAVTLLAGTALPGVLGPVVGTVVGLAAYAGTLYRFGFTDAERRLAGTLFVRYREVIRRG